MNPRSPMRARATRAAFVQNISCTMTCLPFRLPSLPPQRLLGAYDDSRNYDDSSHSELSQLPWLRHHPFIWRYIDVDLNTQRLPDGQQAASLLESAEEHYSLQASVAGSVGESFQKSDDPPPSYAAYALTEIDRQQREDTTLQFTPGPSCTSRGPPADGQPQ